MTCNFIACVTYFFFPLRDSCGRDGIYSFPLIFCKDHLHHNRVGQWWELEYVWPRMLERIGGRSINLLRQQRMSSGNGASGMSSLAHLFPTLNKARRVLVCMDRMISAAMGRPCAIHDDEYVWFLYTFHLLPKSTFALALILIYLSTAMMSTGIIQIPNNDSSNPRIDHL